MNDLHPDVRLTDRLLLWVDRHRRFLFAVIVLVYLAGYNGQWWVNSDSALYVAIARNIANGLGYSYMGQLDRIVEPGLPWTIALGFRLFGVGNFVFPTLVMLASGLAALALVYRLFKMHTDRPTAVMVLLMTALCERVFRYAFETFTDMPFFLGVMLTLVGYERLVRDADATDEPPGYRQPWAWIALAAGLLVLNVYRATALTFMGALAVTVAWHLLRRRMIYRHLTIAGVALVVMVLLRLIDPRRQHVDQAIAREALLGSLLTDRLAWALQRTFGDFLPMLAGETAIEAVLSYRIAPGINHLFCLLIIGIGVWLTLRQRVLWGLLVLATLAQMLVWLPRERYFLPILPLLLFGIWRGLVWINRRWDARRTDAIVAVALVLIVVPNVIQIVREVIGQRRTPFYAHHDKGRVLRLIDLSNRIASVTQPGDLIVADQDRELGYFSERTIIAPVFSRRIPPSEGEMEAYRDRLAAAPRVLVVLPGKDTQRVVEAYGLQLGEPILEMDDVTLRPATLP